MSHPHDDHACAQRPHVTPPRPANIPASLRSLPQWLCWRYEIDHADQRWTKVPIDPRTGQRASHSDPLTWAPLDTALARLARERSLDGIGFVFREGGGIAGIDLDRCRDARTGALSDRARALLRDTSSYAEWSVSGTGMHMLVLGTIPGIRRRNDAAGVELYQEYRWFVMTGALVDDQHTDLVDGQETLETLYAAVFGPDPIRVVADGAAPAPTNRPDDDVLRLAQQHSADFHALWRGKLDENFGMSGGDLALANILAFYSGDPDQVDRLFRQSARMRPKWDERRRGRSTYGEITIDKAFAGRSEYYTADELAPPLGYTKAELDAARSQADEANAQRAAQMLSDDEGHALPDVLLTNRWLRDVLPEALSALEAANRPIPQLFQRGRSLVRVIHVKNQPVIDRFTLESLRTWLSAVANFWRTSEKGKRLRVDVPATLCSAILTYYPWPFPHLEGITDVPIVRADGTVLDRAGYDDATGMLYLPDPHMVWPPIPAQPPRQQVVAATSLIVDDLLGDFPFVGDADRANAVALLLLGFVRHLIDGPTPLHVINAPSPGTGKSLLSDMLLLPAFGSVLGNLGECRDDDEWRKQITGMVLAGARVARIDNIAEPLTSGALSRALTSHVWQDRLLGTSQLVSFPVQAIWVATGNNVTASSEITRRMLHIELNANAERPWQRGGFRHDNLRGWAIRRRPQLLAAALTIIRSWFVAGCPRGAQAPLGSYEAWSGILGGILTHIGMPAFLSGLDRQYDEADNELDTWRAFVDLWYATYGLRPTLVRELLELAMEANIAFNSNYGHAQKAELGLALRKQRNRVIGLYRIEDAQKDRTGSILWRLVRV